jgi:hypothetical protein
VDLPFCAAVLLEITQDRLKPRAFRILSTSCVSGRVDLLTVLPTTLTQVVTYNQLTDFRSVLLEVTGEY